jgi:hypothetical protein
VVNILVVIALESDVNYKGNRFTYHGPNTDGKNTHGAFTSFFTEGSVRVRPLALNFALFQAHGFGMISMYLFLLPLGVYLARYAKSKPFWFTAHITIQITASVGAAIFLIIILVCIPNF